MHLLGSLDLALSYRLSLSNQLLSALLSSCHRSLSFWLLLDHGLLRARRFLGVGWTAIVVSLHHGHSGSVLLLSFLSCFCSLFFTLSSNLGHPLHFCCFILLNMLSSFSLKDLSLILGQEINWRNRLESDRLHAYLCDLNPPWRITLVWAAHSAPEREGR